jgi:hypothetical protein
LLDKEKEYFIQKIEITPKWLEIGIHNVKVHVIPQVSKISFSNIKILDKTDNYNERHGILGSLLL